MRIFWLIGGFILWAASGQFSGERSFAAEFSSGAGAATSSSDYAAAVPGGLPLFLTIPKINLQAAVQGVGLTANNSMGVPTNYVDVGWFKFGPKPGEIGNATMDGHVVTRKFGVGVFYELKKLIPGDKIEVRTATTTLVFRVTKIASYDVRRAPLAEIFGPTSKRRLNLITCDGMWNQARKMYDKRLVVFTELIQAEQ